MTNNNIHSYVLAASEAAQVLISYCKDITEIGPDTFEGHSPKNLREIKSKLQQLAENGSSIRTTGDIYDPQKINSVCLALTTMNKYVRSIGKKVSVEELESALEIGEEFARSPDRYVCILDHVETTTS